MLELLQLPEAQPTSERVAILVGPNGSGKSRFLRKLADSTRTVRNIAVICNTTHDRFTTLRGVPRLSAGRGGSSPKNVIKRAVAMTLDKPDSRFYQIGSILNYCGYRSRFGFRIVRPNGPPPETDIDGTGYEPDDFNISIEFLKRLGAASEIIWVDQSESALSFSRSREFASVLRNEIPLRSRGHIRGIEVYLERGDGLSIELQHASSGELTLISSLVFLISNTGSAPIIIIDEPENSLHPAWQREYVEKILTSMAYRNATVIIATHAPLIVTGALASFPNIVSVFQLQDAQPAPLELSDPSRSGGGIEEILWRAFDVVTPANHFLSEEIVDAVSQYERGERNKGDVIELVDKMSLESFDDKQKQFFGAVKELINNISERKQGAS